MTFKDLRESLIKLKFPDYEKTERQTSQIDEICCRIRRRNSATLSQYTHSITGDNYSSPTNLMDENNSDDNQETKMWTARSETKLINMLRDEVRKNQTTGRTTSWTIRHWNHYANQLHNLYGFRYTATQVRQKYQRLKADYQTFKRLQAQTGLGWDPIVGTVVAPDEFWDKANRNVKKFRTKGFEYFQEMAEIVENCCATGALSRASTQGALDSEEEDDMLNKFWNPDVGGSNAGGSNAAEAIPVDLYGDEYMDPAKGKSHKRGPTTSQTDSGRSKKSRSSGFDDVCAAFTSYVQAKTGHSRARENETEAVSAGGDDYSLDACQDALLELGDIPPVQYIKALTLFKDKEWRRFFMRTPTHLRLPMILALQ
ncbi:hypothetical protein HYC85_028463 [Camellia sinensis]|uniref:Myb/SANT-like domain-containing protein n=1 Tax=Camellia sinensis TaxID=4442 RepID=A0A7J7FVD9_CAMSI|nr:hypothetical protein HYC85_028463 [Camellia sinensis]